MKIQQTHINELNSIWIIKNRCVNYLLTQNIKTWDESYPSYSVFEIDQQASNLYTIIDDDIVIGSVCVNQEMSDEYFNIKWSDENFLVIHRLMIDPGMQGKGYAKTAMQLLEKLIIKKGISSIRLAVYENNVNANLLYKKLGFRLKGKCMMRNGLSLMYEKIVNVN